MAVNYISSPISIANNRIDLGHVKPPYDGRRFSVYDGVSNGNKLLYTVPSGKKALLFGYAAHAYYSGTSGTYAYFAIRDSTPTIIYLPFYVGGHTNIGSVVDSCAFTYPLELDEGYNVWMISQNAFSNIRVSVYGVETNA